MDDTEIVEHIGYVSLELPVRKSYGNLHLKMEESTGATTLTNLGRLVAATASLSGGKFVTVCVCINYKNHDKEKGDQMYVQTAQA